MGITRTDLYTSDQNELADSMKLFSNPARIAIMEYLLKSCTCINGDLVKELGLAQATISQHLKELKHAGIIRGEIEGQRQCYCIDNTKWEAHRLRIIQFLNQFS